MFYSGINAEIDPVAPALWQFFNPVRLGLPVDSNNFPIASITASIINLFQAKIKLRTESPSTFWFFRKEVNTGMPMQVINIPSKALMTGVVPAR
jgi:hypothetical protein